MKKGLKLGLALAVGGLAQEGIAQSTHETNKNIQGVFGENKNWKGDTSETYIVPAADLQKQKEKQVDSLDATQAISIFNDTVNTLIKSYGEEGLNKRIHEINQEYPDFVNLPEGKQKEIIMEKFIDQKDVVFALI